MEDKFPAHPRPKRGTHRPMSYSEKDGQVVLTMSIEDWQRLLMLLGACSAHASHGGKSVFQLNDILALLNRLNEGNPHYKPYAVAEKLVPQKGDSAK